MNTNLGVNNEQMPLGLNLNDIKANITPPTTRYQGSKLKLSGWLWENIGGLKFQTALDVFGGTGTVSFLLKTNGKTVQYNDALNFNSIIGRAFIENKNQTLSIDEIDEILNKAKLDAKSDFISKTFEDIYFTSEENRWLDSIIPKIHEITNPYKQALAFYALFQSCIIKRPYNLFHRKNLYVRTAEVKRTFGNKTSWDTPFDVHYKKFALEGNLAVFDNGNDNKSTCLDAFDVTGNFDLVYMDPPYTSSKGVSVDYHQFYHFLEGIVDYDRWPQTVDYKSKHRRLIPKYNVWNDKHEIGNSFSRLFEKFKNSILVVSYRSEGIPSIDEIQQRMSQFKSKVSVLKMKNYQYALSTASNDEVLIIGT